jgi:alpha-1,6-mannosyltransferase
VNATAHKHKPFLQNYADRLALGLGAALAFAGVAQLLWVAWHPARALSGLFVLGSLCMFAGSVVLWRAWRTPSHRALITLAVLMHLVSIGTPALYEDDGYRYLWDGYRTAETLRPYGKAPEAFFADETLTPALQELLSGVNNPDVPTIYGPTAQYLFALSYLIAPADELAWRLVITLLHVTLFGFALAGGKQSPEGFTQIAPGSAIGLDQRHVGLLYLFNPLVYKEIALTGHFDFLVGFALLFTLRLYRLDGMLRWWAMGVVLAVATGIKVVAVLALPILLLAQLHSFTDTRGWRALFQAAWRVGLAFAATLLALYLPLIDVELGIMGTDWAGLSQFSSEWSFNAGVYAMLQMLLGVSTAKVALTLALLGSLAWLAMRSQIPLAWRLQWVFAALILLGPVVNPWYWLWLLPLGLLSERVSISGFVIGTLLLVAYLHGLYVPGKLAPYELPRALQFTEHFAILLCMAMWVRSACRAKQCAEISQ